MKLFYLVAPSQLRISSSVSVIREQLMEKSELKSEYIRNCIYLVIQEYNEGWI